jgi:hypothetical protein
MSSSLFQKLWARGEDEDEARCQKQDQRHFGPTQEVFAAWAEVLPLLCKVEKLEPNEAMHNLARFNC